MLEHSGLAQLRTLENGGTLPRMGSRISNSVVVLAALLLTHVTQARLPHIDPGQTSMFVVPSNTRRGMPPRGLPADFTGNAAMRVGSEDEDQAAARHR